MTETELHDLPEPKDEPKTKDERAQDCYQAIEAVLKRHRCKLAFQGKAIIANVERVGQEGAKVLIEAEIDRYAFGIEPLD